MKIKTLVFSLSLIALSSFSAFADNPLDTTAGNIVTAEGTANVMRYTDTGNSTKDAIRTSTIEVIVDAMYGVDPLDSASAVPAVNYVHPGTILTYSYLLTNEGNAAFTPYVAIRSSKNWYGSLPTAYWQWYITQEGDATQYYICNELYTSAGFAAKMTTIEEDATRKIYLNVVIQNIQNQTTLTGNYLSLTLEVFNNFQTMPSLQPYGLYYGANGYQYAAGTLEGVDGLDGGIYVAHGCVMISIETSAMTISRVATVDSPKAAGGKFTGDPHAAVPGAIITYTIMTSNEGNGDAKNVVIIDKVPLVGGAFATNLCHIGAGAGSQGTIPNVNITALPPTATGWHAYYSSYFAPMTDYGYIGSQWITADSWPVDLHTDTSAMWVKFEKATLSATEDAKTLTWGVTIR
jgi:uncharacterized repeat protein (TIGR01451 family)